MPELPEVETIKRQLNISLKGKEIKDVFVRTDKMVKVGEGKISNIKKGTKQASEKFRKLLKGSRIKEIGRRGKFLIIQLDKGQFLFIHLRMSGQLIFHAKGKMQPAPGKHTHVEIIFTDGSKLFYNDYRQFGHMRLVNEKERGKVLEQEGLGPEPLEMSEKEFFQTVKAHSKKRAKEFLLNQKAIAGIGNIYADESLFEAKILPARKIGELKEREIKSLYASVKKVLARAIELKGSSIRSYVNINGASGKFANEHKVYGRAGKPCLKCGRALSFSRVGGRATVFCLSCQK